MINFIFNLTFATHERWNISTRVKICLKPAMRRLEALPCLEAASRLIFTALVLVLRVDVLVLVLVLTFDVLVLVLILRFGALVQSLHVLNPVSVQFSSVCQD